MTLGQLRAFATVARLRSVRAAAASLGVSEPAVSAAVAALRKELGDELFVRDGAGIAFTPGGRRLAARAAELLGLADLTRREVAEARGADTLLRVAAESRVAEEVAPPLLDAFVRRVPRLQVALSVEPPDTFAHLLADRAVDVVLGPRPAPAVGVAVTAVPFLRHRLAIVAGPGHRLADADEVAFETLAGETWLAGPLGVDPLTTEGLWLARQRLWPGIRVLDTHAATRTAAARGEGITFAAAHSVRDHLRRGELVPLPVRGTPLTGFWFAGVLGRDHLPPAVRSLLRFVTTPEATQAVLSGAPAEGAARFRPPVHVDLWST